MLVVKVIVVLHVRVKGKAGRTREPWVMSDAEALVRRKKEAYKCISSVDQLILFRGMRDGGISGE